MGGSGDKSPLAKLGQSKHLSSAEYFGSITDAKEASKILAKKLSANSGKKITAKQADAMWDSVLTYSGSKYTEIREYQKTGKGNSKIRKDAEQVENYIAVAPKWQGGTLYRGINVTQDVLNGFKVGAKINNGGTSSWTDKKDNAKTFTRGLNKKVIFVMDKTKRGTSITHLSNHPKEAEVLVSAKSSMKITKLKKQNGVTYVHVIEV